MALSCECGDGDYSWYYTVPENYTTLQTKRRKRCSSCKELIDVGAVALEFECVDVEDQDGNEKPMASKFLCEECGDIYYSLDDLGFCVAPDDSMKEMLKDYQETYGAKS